MKQACSRYAFKPEPHVLTLTGTSNREHDLRRMPCTNTSDLAKTLVSLARKLLGTPTMGDTLESVTLGDTNDIYTLILLENGSDLNWLLEQAMGEFNLVGYRATVDLDLHKVGLLLAETGLADLCVGKNTDDGAVFADTLEFTGNRLAAILSVLLGVSGERLLLRSVPVLVESTLDFVGEMGGPDGGESAQATGCLDVTNNTDNNEGWCFDDRYRFDDFTLVHLWKKGIISHNPCNPAKDTNWSLVGRGHGLHGSYQPCSP